MQPDPAGAAPSDGDDHAARGHKYIYLRKTAKVKPGQTAKPLQVFVSPRVVHLPAPRETCDLDRPGAWVGANAFLSCVQLLEARRGIPTPADCAWKRLSVTPPTCPRHISLTAFVSATVQEPMFLDGENVSYHEWQKNADFHMHRRAIQQMQVAAFHSLSLLFIAVLLQ